MDKTCNFVGLNIFMLFMTCQMCCCLAKTSTNLTTDELALLDFKAHITSDPYQRLTSNWSNSTSVCSWVGVTCGLRHRRVVSLNISNMGVSGTISPHLGNLSFLRALDLGFNNLSGSLPQELSLLHRLKFISMINNSLVGDMPSWLGLFPRLALLNLRSNSFTGPIPKHLSNLSNLRVVEFSLNKLDGEIPQELGRLHNLQVVSIQGNHLSGVIPSSIFNISTLQIIALTDNELSGSLPNDMCANLPFLQGVYLGSNKLSGQIPSNLSECAHLQLLSLSYNWFHGGIPAAIGELTTLRTLQLGGNKLNGSIPEGIGNLQRLMELGVERNEMSGRLPTNIYNMSSLHTSILHNNKLVGKLPTDITNLTALTKLVLSYNHFTGVVPRGMGQVEDLTLGFNSLTGIIPPELFNISTLGILQLQENALSGTLPTNMCYASPLLRILYLDNNHLTGVVPDSISNCTNLENLSLSFNRFTTLQPRAFANLPFLQGLRLHGNMLRIDVSSLITPLTNCRSLRVLGINDNPAYGIIPPSVGNFSFSLQFLYAHRCKINGELPPHIGNLSNLVLLSLFGNELSGNIPPAIKHMNILQALNLNTNKLSGLIPEGLCGLNSLSILSLGENLLLGPIPECLGNVTSLRYLHLFSNNISSNIPSSLWGLKDLLELDLSSNNLSGALPLQIQNLAVAIYIDFSSNHLSESIPSTIGSLKNLLNLSLAENRLQGSIPASVGSMLSLVSLDLSHNNLSGSIPKSLEALRYLKYLNVSFNDLSGEIPTAGPFANLTPESFVHNEALCGAPRFNIPPCHTTHVSKKKVGFALFIVAGVVGLIAIICLAIILTRCRRKENRGGGVDEFASVIQERISYYEILQATENFGESNLLGFGSFGCVYRGLLRDGRTIAVKVFTLQLEAALRSFDVECEVLRNIRHRNLIKVISSCSNESFKALVLEYMPNGSLEKWLYSHNYCLDVLQRLNIMIDVASALEYLHHGYSTPIVHCDLKPSNVLLDEEMIGRVSDFGIAKLLATETEESNVVTNTLATLGYIAPEYGLEGLVSRKSDVYSYGIMLMETFTRKKPSDDMFGGELSLKSWVESSFGQSIHEVIDANLVNPEERCLEKKLKCVYSVLNLAMKCAAESPQDRINMKEALAELHKIKHQFLH